MGCAWATKCYARDYGARPWRRGIQRRQCRFEICGTPLNHLAWQLSTKRKTTERKLFRCTFLTMFWQPVSYLQCVSAKLRGKGRPKKKRTAAGKIRPFRCRFDLAKNYPTESRTAKKKKWVMYWTIPPCHKSVHYTFIAFDIGLLP
jgi:hypothetical protein